jgi:hypothetical protein
MESLIESGYFAGVLDITTTEWADEVCGRVLSAGPTRLEAAGKMGVPRWSRPPASICATSGRLRRSWPNTVSACSTSGIPT